jgi:penicillin-binding protein 1A
MRFDMRVWLRWAAIALVVGGVGAAAAGLGVLVVVFGTVWFGDDSHLKKTAILARINEESGIYCLDEEQRIGSFFNNEHRRYVPIDEVPAHMINALVAAEDKNFFEHRGVDPVAIFKAVLEGLQTGRFRGASTLTQQTVKNLLDNWEYSIRRKVREAIAAMQLERLYSKRQILEFYLNQFHVSGNGTGIGIAARYYFNKEVRDLDLVESAFIAGSVKGPSRYDPFIKYTREHREAAVKAAFDRKNYVVRRMYEQGWITEAELREAWEKPVPFNRGSFRTSEVALVSLVKGQLERREILDALQVDTADDLSRAGYKVYTTLDCKLQEAAQLGVRRNLSRLETILGGFKPEQQDMFKRLRDLTVNEFYFGKVEEVVGNEKDGHIKVTFGLSTGVIPYDSLVRYSKLLDLALLEGHTVQLKKLMQTVKPGDVLFVEVREYDKEKHEAVLELHKRPKINGGLVALDKGELRAAVSGFDTKGFNRAMFAKRQPGSVFKSVVYYAALQLGWTLLDRLDNERQLFAWQGRFYYPRPDHATPYKETSMIWSGAMSENLASVALAAHLVDKLNFEQFKQLMGALDILPRPGEAQRDFHYRVARYIGVQLDNDGVREYQLQNAISDVAPDLVFAGQSDTLRRLGKMWWGKGYVSELQALYAQEGDAMPPYEKALRIGLVRNNFLRFGALAQALASDWNTITEAVGSRGAEAAFSDPALRPLFTRFKVLASSGNRPALGYFQTLDGEAPRRDYERRADIERFVQVPGRPLNALDVQSIWSSGVFTAADLSLNDVLLDGHLGLGMYNKLQASIAERYEAVMATQSDFDLYRYFQHHDFRIGIGLKYVVELVKAMGVTSPVEPVLSFPLGTNDVTAAEVAKIYQTFISGKIYKFYEKGPPNQINLIKRIEDRFGNVLLEPKPQIKQLGLPEYSAQMREILKRVVTHGTGRRARGELHVDVGGSGENTDNAADKATDKDGGVKIRVNSFGKTGTTNDYGNAYFAGFFPFPIEKGSPLEFDNSYAIASYVGYDIAKAMRRGGVKVSGSLGALPMWIDLAKAMIDQKKYADFIDPLDINVISKGEWPMRYDPAMAAIKVDLPRGVVLSAADEADGENFAITDIDRTGENPENEFAIGNLVRSVVRVAEDKKAGGALRIFSPVPIEQEGKAPAQAPVILDAGQGQQGMPLPDAGVDGGGGAPSQSSSQLPGVQGPIPTEDVIVTPSTTLPQNSRGGISPEEELFAPNPSTRRGEQPPSGGSPPRPDGATPPAKGSEPEKEPDSDFIEEELW